MKMIIDGRYKARLSVMKQECSVIMGRRDFVLLLLNFVTNSFPRLSDLLIAGLNIRSIQLN